MKWLDAVQKRRFPNKLGTRNWSCSSTWHKVWSLDIKTAIVYQTANICRSPYFLGARLESPAVLTHCKACTKPSSRIQQSNQQESSIFCRRLCLQRWKTWGESVPCHHINFNLKLMI